MTISIAVQCSDGAVLACDGRVTSSCAVESSTVNKIEQWGPGFWIAYAGDLATIQKLRRENEPGDVWELGAAVNEAAGEEDLGCEFLAHYDGQLWCVDSGGGVTEVNAYAMVGSGSEHSRALMHHLLGPTPPFPTSTVSGMLRGSVLPAVCRVNPTCGPPFYTKVFGGTESSVAVD